MTGRLGLDAQEPEGGKFHVERAELPWRTGDRLTECGRPADSIPAADLLTRTEARTRAKAWGQRRAALVLCMTCSDTSGRWPSWDQDPVGVVVRDARGYGIGARDDRRELLAREMRAFELLRQAHPEEFAEAVEGLAETASIDKARRDRAAERARHPSGRR